jgi:hypothetical protein
MNTVINYDEFSHEETYLENYSSILRLAMSWNTPERYNLGLVYFRTDDKSKSVEREGYTLFNYFGDIGGVISILIISGQFFVQSIAEANLTFFITKALFLVHSSFYEGFGYDKK